MKQLTPAQHIINQIGGIRKTARVIGRDPSAVCRWNRPKSKGGTGGEIPRLVIQLILSYASEKNLDITLHDVYAGRKA